MRQWTDADPEEDGLLSELDSPLGALRALRGQCPEPVLLEAARAGVVPDDVAARVADHASRCRVCRILARDLADPELTAPTEPEAARIRAIVVGARDWRRPASVGPGIAGIFARDAGRPAPAGPVAADVGVQDSWRPASAGRKWAARLTRAVWLGWSWRPMLVAATLVAVTAVVLWPVTDPPSPTEVAAARQVPPPRSQPRLVLEKPPVTMPLAAVLIWRSESRAAQDQYLAALGNALTPYRADDFAEAARRLQVLARDHPTAEVRFYLGVSRLFLGHDDLAIADLGQARELAEPALAREATWYLAVAHERAGRPDAAAAELVMLCGEEGERQAKACDALRAGLLPGSATRQRR